MNISNTLGWLRLTGIIEGLSYLILLAIAMPLKYLAGKPEMVSMVGMAHGILFVLYVVLSFLAKLQYSWTWGRVWTLWIASVVPFGTFYIDYKLLRHENV